jgi:uncharacterized protein (TIGR02246 family)
VEPAADPLRTAFDATFWRQPLSWKDHVMTDPRTALRNGAAPPRSSDAHQDDRSEAQQRAEIVGLLKRYERSLNAGDVAGVIRLYTDDAVMLAPGAPSAVGIDAVRAAYTGTFQTIDYDLTFEVAETKVVSGDWAFLRTTSHGTVRILANGTQVPRSNHELFVLQQHHGRWKLARYSFSSALPSA